MTLSEELQWRGLIAHTTLKDIKQLDGQPISFYLGVDPSADSMTVGNLAVAMLVRRFIEHGHNAYLLVGGATGLIGDPDGKSNERSTKSHDEISANKEKIRLQYDQIFREQKYQIVDNYDWFKEMNYLEFLREVGKYVPLSSMLARDFVKARLGEDGSGISYAEFSYSLIQGYDFLHLYKEKAVTLQLCGSDQIGNVIAGIDLIRRKEAGEANLLAMPLIVNKNTGVKFGKSEDGAVWLDANKTSVYAFYQFWLNDDDESVIDHLKVYTMLSKEEIDDIALRHKDNPEQRTAQKTLAYEVSVLVHGQDRTNSVMRVTNVLFGDEKFENLNEQDLEILSREIPTATRGQNLVDILTATGLAASGGEARRLLQGGAITLSGVKLSDNIVLNDACLIKKGKNKFVLVR